MAQMRARGRLVEMRAADLRFTSAEAAAHLSGPMGLGLSDDDVAALEGRTEASAVFDSPGIASRYPLG